MFEEEIISATPAEEINMVQISSDKYYKWIIDLDKEIQFRYGIKLIDIQASHPWPLFANGTNVVEAATILGEKNDLSRQSSSLKG